jgi:hypothetical protein
MRKNRFEQMFSGGHIGGIELVQIAGIDEPGEMK